MVYESRLLMQIPPQVLSPGASTPQSYHVLSGRIGSPNGSLHSAYSLAHGCISCSFGSTRMSFCLLGCVPGEFLFTNAQYGRNATTNHTTQQLLPTGQPNFPSNFDYLIIYLGSFTSTTTWSNLGHSTFVVTSGSTEIIPFTNMKPTPSCQAIPATVAHFMLNLESSLSISVIMLLRTSHPMRLCIGFSQLLLLMELSPQTI